MIKARVIGYPLQHTLSPLIHRHWFETLAIVGHYSGRPIPPADLASGIAAMVAAGIKGFNVTIPHKQAIMPLCATLDDAARAIGAVNTVVVGDDGTLQGRNTDAIGFTRNIECAMPDFDWKAGPALVLGAGGAARAVVHALRQKGVTEIRIANRTRQGAEELADSFGATVLDWDERDHDLTDVRFLVNTTALGMAGKPPLALDLSTLPTDAMVTDIVYVPLMTDLLISAQARGNPIVTGIGMLLHQAAPAFHAWTGVMPEVTPVLERIVLAACR